MRTRNLIATISLAASALVASTGVARAEKFVIDDDTFLNIGALAQPQLQLNEHATPDDGWNSDFYLRRARIVLSGQVDPHIGFVLITDMPNYGKGGVYDQPFVIQDALASYKFGPELTIDAGFMLLPFLRHNYLSAGALNTVDFRVGLVKFPTARAFRDMGLEVRGLLLDDRIYYRAGVFQGQASKAEVMGPPLVPALNPSDAPRLTGTVRFNLAGKEDAYAFSGIYFAKEPVISIGVGADYQNEAFGAKTKYLAFNADVFADYPIDADNEVIGSAAFIRYQDYASAGGPESANAFYVEGGYRFQMIEPVLTFESFDGENTLRLSTLRAGLDWWITQHRYNLKLELALPMNEDGASVAQDARQVTLQTQVVF
jgi:hypothetical protein